MAHQGYDLQLTRYDARGRLRRRTRPEGLRALAAVPAFGVPASDPSLAKVPADRRGVLFVHVAEAIEAIPGSCRLVAKEGFELLPHSPHSVEAMLPAVSGAVNPPWRAVARNAARGVGGVEESRCRRRRAVTAQFQPAARMRRFFCFFLKAARLRAVFLLRLFSRMAVSYRLGVLGDVRRS